VNDVLMDNAQALDFLNHLRLLAGMREVKHLHPYVQSGSLKVSQKKYGRNFYTSQSIEALHDKHKARLAESGGLVGKPRKVKEPHDE